MLTQVRTALFSAVQYAVQCLRALDSCGVSIFYSSGVVIIHGYKAFIIMQDLPTNLLYTVQLSIVHLSLPLADTLIHPL